MQSEEWRSESLSYEDRRAFGSMYGGDEQATGCQTHERSRRSAQEAVALRRGIVLLLHSLIDCNLYFISLRSP